MLAVNKSRLTCLVYRTFTDRRSRCAISATSCVVFPCTDRSGRRPFPTSGVAMTWTSPALAPAYAAPARSRHRPLDRDRSGCRTVVHLLRERLRAVRHAPRAGLRAVRPRRDGAGLPVARSAVGLRADRLVGPGRDLERVAHGFALPPLRTPALRTSPATSGPDRAQEVEDHMRAMPPA
jgi:hypothetical protein